MRSPNERRKLWTLGLGTLLSAVLISCGGGSGAVGDSCGAAGDCPEATMTACITAWPGGYCSEVGCSDRSCPAGSHCVRGVEFPDVEQDAFCAKTCTTAGDCRGEYDCKTAGSRKVCAP